MTDNLATLRGGVQAGKSVVDRLLAKAAKIDAGKDTYTPQNLAQQHTEARQQAFVELAQLRQDLAEARAQATKDAQKSLGAALNVGQDLGEQVAAQRAWARLRGLLEAGTVDYLGLIERAKHDSLTLRALREELPAYLETTGINQPGEMAQHVTSEIDKRLLPYLKHSERAALDTLKALDTGWRNLEMSIGFIELDLKAGAGDRMAVLIGYDGEEIDGTNAAE